MNLFRLWYVALLKYRRQLADFDCAYWRSAVGIARAELAASEARLERLDRALSDAKYGRPPGMRYE